MGPEKSDSRRYEAQRESPSRHLGRQLASGARARPAGVVDDGSATTSVRKKLFQSAIPVLESRLGEDHSSTLSALNNLGYLYNRRKEKRTPRA